MVEAIGMSLRLAQLEYEILWGRMPRKREKKGLVFLFFNMDYFF